MSATSWSQTQDVKHTPQDPWSRSQIYGNPELTQWAGNGGDSINKKIQQLLNKLGKSLPGAEQVVKEEVANLSKKKNPGKTKLKASSTSSPSPSPKKRKRIIKDEAGSDLDDW